MTFISLNEEMPYSCIARCGKASREAALEKKNSPPTVCANASSTFIHKDSGMFPEVFVEVQA